MNFLNYIQRGGSRAQTIQSDLKTFLANHLVFVRYGREARPIPRLGL